MSPNLGREYLQQEETEEHDDEGEVGGEGEAVAGTEALVDGQEQSGAHVAEDVVEVEAWVVAEADVVYQLRHQYQVPQHDHPLVVAEEVAQTQVQEQAQVCILYVVQNWM